VAVFVYSLIPFFFLHFIVIFVRRYEILKSKRVIGAIYTVGLFCYAMVLLHYIPTPVSEAGIITESGYIFYLTWMTIFFAVGVALLYESARGFYEKAGRANLLFVSFILLLLVLPGPFTDSVFFNILHLGREWYYFSCTFAVIIAVYFIFRHKIIINTLYDGLKMALAVVNDILITTDNKFKIEMVQGAITPLLGYKEYELLGRNLAEFIEQKEYLEQYSDLVHRNKMKQSYFDTDIITQSGKHIPMNFSFTPMMFDKEVTGFVGIGRDITEHKLLEGQLRQAQKMESLGTLAGGIAHEFNNILQIMLINTSSLLKNIQKPEKVEQLIGINQTTLDRGTALVKQILMFARKTEVEFQPMDVNALIQELIKMLSMTFPKTLSFSSTLDQSLPKISGDRNQLHQVLLNLCVNARDAMPDGGRVLFSTALIPLANIKGFSDAHDDSYVCISVTDTGPGMDEATRSRIFEPFFTTKEKGKGTGLGLAVVYGIVKAHRGFIEVHTSVGRGTSFHIYLPNSLRPSIKDNSSGDVTVSHSKGSETILVVEDEEVLLDFLKSLLEDAGYTVLTAKDGVDAVEVYKKHYQHISLVLSDAGLPKLDGWNVLRKMKELNSALKAIVASGYFEPQEKVPSAESGIYGFVQKPYKPNDILKSVRTVLDNHSL